MTKKVRQVPDHLAKKLFTSAFNTNMKKFVLLLLSFTLLVVASGCSSEPTPNDSTDPAAPASAQTDNADNSAGATPAPSETTEDANSAITDAVVQRVCNCQAEAKQADGTMDFPQMVECMGGKNKTEFVEDLLGPGASEKARADATRELTRRMNETCPRS